MDIAGIIFDKKTVDLEKLVDYGFSEKDNVYSYSAVMPGCGFMMTVNITTGGEISTSVIDPAFREPYTLHLADSAEGKFVGSVRDEYESVLRNIADKCFRCEIFKCEQTKAVVDYVKNTYGDSLEFLWQKFPDNAVVRRKDNKKWYAAFLTVSRRKIGLDSDEKVEIIDLRLKPEDIETAVDGVKIFPGYHMNKKHWITICLDGSISFEEICRRTDESYRLAKKGRR